MTIMIFNKTTHRFIKHVNAAIFENTTAIPYDVTMYDVTLQENINCESRDASESFLCSAGRVCEEMAIYPRSSFTKPFVYFR